MKRLSVPAVLILSALAGCSKSAVGTSPPAYEMSAADGAADPGSYDAPASEDAYTYDVGGDGDEAYAEAPAEEAVAAGASAPASESERSFAAGPMAGADFDDAEPAPAAPPPMADAPAIADESAAPRRSRRCR